MKKNTILKFKSNILKLEVRFWIDEITKFDTSIFSICYGGKTFALAGSVTAVGEIDGFINLFCQSKK